MVLITEMIEICIQASYDQNVQLILKSYLPVVYGTPLIAPKDFCIIWLSNLLTIGVPDERFFFQKRVVRTKLDIYVYDADDRLGFTTYEKK